MAFAAETGRGGGRRIGGLVAGLPTAVPFVAPEEIERRRGARFELRLGANESAFGPSPAAAAAAGRELRRVAWYGDPRSHELRERLASLTGRRREEIVVGSGIDDLIGLAVRCTLEPGALALATGGTYPTFGYHVRGFGGELCAVPYDSRLRVDLDRLAAEAARLGAAVVYVANPDNPSGSAHPDAALVELAEALPPGCTLLLDEAYWDFVTPRLDAPQPLPDNLIRLRTFSKGHALAGLRIGYALAAEQYIEAFEKVRLHFGVNRVAQSAALASLGDEEHLLGVVEMVAEERSAYERMGRDLGWSPIPSSTNFVAFDLGDADTAAALVLALEDAGVFVRRGAGPPLDRCLRITVGSPGQRRRLEAELQRLQRQPAVVASEGGRR